MTKDEIQKLADLARIEIQDKEASVLAEDITSIVGYVSAVDKITAKTDLEKKVGAVHNVFREDENPHESGIYTEALLDAAPDRDGQYIRVKKILGGDS